MPKQAIPSDYDSNSERFRANVRAVEQYGLASDVHEEIADRVVAKQRTPVLDVGCGEGRLTKPLHERGIATIAFDYFDNVKLDFLSNSAKCGMVIFAV